MAASRQPKLAQSGRAPMRVALRRVRPSRQAATPARHRDASGCRSSSGHAARAHCYRRAARQRLTGSVLRPPTARTARRHLSSRSARALAARGGGEPRVRRRRAWRGAAARGARPAAELAALERPTPTLCLGSGSTSLRRIRSRRGCRTARRAGPRFATVFPRHDLNVFGVPRVLLLARVARTAARDAHGPARRAGARRRRIHRLTATAGAAALQRLLGSPGRARAQSCPSGVDRPTYPRA
jgi:hypothetical protein